MKLIGMLDSPYVRRTAISLKQMGISFALDQLSVFSGYDKIAALNPAVKVPTLVTDDGVVLMDSSLIVDFARRLLGKKEEEPDGAENAMARHHRLLGLALVASEKTLHVVYERVLRPAEKIHAPWLERVERQLVSTYELLEAEYGQGAPARADGSLSQSEIMSAVAWRFSREMLPDLVQEQDHPALAAHSARCEATPEFKAYPYPAG